MGPSRHDFFLVVVLVQVMLQDVVCPRLNAVYDEGIEQLVMIVYLENMHYITDFF